MKAVLRGRFISWSTFNKRKKEEYEELLRYAIVTPNIESSALQTSHPKGEVVPDVRIPTTTDNSLHNQGSSPVLSPRKSSHPVMDFFSSHLLGDSSSSVSNSTHTDAHEIALGDSLVFDENLQKMENILDFWSSSLKVISSLSHAIGKQKERIELMRTFFHWRIGHVSSRQDVYECKLADQYFQRTLLKKTWKGWRSIIQRQWKEVVERACQARAEEVCVQISNDYEAKVAMLSGALENAKTEIQRMQHDKEHFEDSMKKAFMRGVCALNLEAMTMFQNRNDTGIEFTNNKKEEYGPVVQGKEHCIHSDSSMPSIPPMPSAVPLHLLQSSPAVTVGTASATAVPSAVSMTSAGAASASAGAASASSVQVHVPVSVLGAGSSITTTSEEMYVPRVVTSAHQRAGRTITARITGRCDFASKNRINSSLAIMGVSPPMSSVIVEKHHPVTVQTIPQASAAKYSRSIHPEGNTSASRSLGTRSTHGTQSLTSVQSIKVVD
ncbi:Centrosomal protein POC5 [Sciurus carolinensis]|uniref:Centrosomal protein POC5 n=1 Tax=Sciurus carolinensis TaxID=30640 RepID=A0AA41MGK4_SCICA|nr:Centrosomal protein POC5 [Sciurus carolinensis]